MTPDTKSFSALIDVLFALEAFRADHLNSERAVALVHALERYDPASANADYLQFLGCRDQLIRELISLHPHAFPSQAILTRSGTRWGPADACGSPRGTRH